MVDISIKLTHNGEPSTTPGFGVENVDEAKDCFFVNVFSTVTSSQIRLFCLTGVFVVVGFSVASTKTKNFSCFGSHFSPIISEIKSNSECKKRRKRTGLV